MRAKDKLKDLGVRPRKERGQNFLIDDLVLEQIAMFIGVKSDDTVVEIGPGLGALTKRLSKAAQVILIEVESAFCDKLKLDYPNYKILNQDVRTVDFTKLRNECLSRLLVVGNLPYSLSTDIIFTLISYAKDIRRAVLLLQKEFAERMASAPGSKEYGALSIACGLWADMRLGPVVPGDLFHPPTEVESRIIEMKFLPEPRYQIKDQLHFRQLVAAAFSKRRKKLSNSLLSAYSGDKIENALTAVNISGDLRAEDLSVSDYVRLSNFLV